MDSIKNKYNNQDHKEGKTALYSSWSEDEEFESEETIKMREGGEEEEEEEEELEEENGHEHEHEINKEKESENAEEHPNEEGEKIPNINTETGELENMSVNLEVEIDNAASLDPGVENIIKARTVERFNSARKDKKVNKKK